MSGVARPSRNGAVPEEVRASKEWKATRLRLMAELGGGVDGYRVYRTTGRFPTAPAVAYAYLFHEYLDPMMERKVVGAYESAQPESRGWIYVFSDERDPKEMLKIGYTRQSVKKRLTQWRRDLRDFPGEPKINMLFWEPARMPELAETVLHRILWARHVPHLFNAETGAELREYFSVPERASLRWLVRAVIRHTDAYAAALETINESSREYFSSP